MSGPFVLSANNLGVSLAGRAVLAGISFTLPPARFVALVGPNGAGKTTLLRALAGLLPAQGAVEVRGKPLATMPLAERARRFGYMPQGHQVHWPLQVRDVVALGRYPHGAHDPARLSPEDADIVAQVMATADILPLADRRVTELSGGERGRVALARALAVQAPVLLADEPTASLDPGHQLDVMKALRAIADSGVLVIAATHDLSMAARFAHDMLVLRSGRLVAHAAPEQALSDEVLADVFGVNAYRIRRDGEPVIVPWSRS